MTTLRSSALHVVNGHAELTVSSGAGNLDDVPEVHVQMRYEDPENGRTYVSLGWFNADDLLKQVAHARSAAPEVRRVRLTEPAVEAA